MNNNNFLTTPISSNIRFKIFYCARGYFFLFLSRQYLRFHFIFYFIVIKYKLNIKLLFLLYNTEQYYMRNVECIVQCYNL